MIKMRVISQIEVALFVDLVALSRWNWWPAPWNTQTRFMSIMLIFPTTINIYQISHYKSLKIWIFPLYNSNIFNYLLF